MFGLFKKKKIEPICGNCKLFDSRNRRCQVVVLHEGERLHVPVDAADPCFFEQQYFDPVTGKVEDFNDIQEVKFWVEDKNGKKTDKDGTVKIEFPEGFFGDGKTLKDMLG